MTRPPLLLVQAIEEALARALALDSRASSKLRKLEGRSLSIDLSGTPVRFTLRVVDGAFAVAAGLDDGADATIRGTPGSLLALSMSENTLGGKVEISGDAGRARQFQKAFADIDPDWEEPLTRLFGDVIGFQIAQALRGFWTWAKDAVSRLAGDAREYLQEESRVLVHPLELESFMDDVDDLRDDTARLEKRIARLRKRRG